MSKVIAIAIDAEFTAFDMIGGDMIALGAVEILEDLTLGREWQGLLKPRSEKYFTDGAREVHGVSYFKALTFPERVDTMLDFLEWLSPLTCMTPIPVAFFGSWGFDLRWIKLTLEDCDLGPTFPKIFTEDKTFNLNVYQMARKMLKHIELPPNGERKGMYKLDNVCRFLKINLDHHNALSDTRACAEIYCKLMKGENIWTGELF